MGQDQFDVSITPQGWSISRDNFRLEATGIIRDRGNVKATVSVYNLQTQKLLYRDNVNLTGEKSRQRFLKSLQQNGGEVPLKALLALDEAIRRTPAASRNGHKADFNHCDTPSDISGTPLSFAELKEAYGEWLLLEDYTPLEVVLGAKVAHELGGESPWVLLVAPPSGVKTEMLRALYGAKGVYPLSELTARTFASGLDAGEKETSLLARLHDETLVLKDFTTVLEMHREERQAILAQLREIYDGRFDKAWGTGKELHWVGRLGFLAGVTPVIDQHHSVMAILGPRFLQLRLEQPDRLEVAKRAMDNSGSETAMRDQLARATARFLAGVSATPPEVGDGVVKWLARVADVVTRARSSVIRDGYKRELDYAPEPEGPARFARQLYALLQGITLINGHSAPTVEGVACVTRVARDCIPKVRQLAIQALLKVPEGQKTGAVAHNAQYSTNTMRRSLEDLQSLGLVRCDKGSQGHSDQWALEDDKSRDVLSMLFAPADQFKETFPEMSDEASHTEKEEEEVVEWTG
jgi:hypothetical protein